MIEEIVSEWEDALTTGRRSNLRLGELAYELEVTGNLQYATIVDALQKRGTSAPDKTTVSRYKRVHFFWRVNWQYPVEELERVGISKLALLASHIEENGGDPDELLEQAKRMTRTELNATLKGEAAQPEDKWPWTQEPGVKEAFTTGAERLYRTVGYDAHSLTPAFEFAALLLQGMSEEFLREAWAQAHGEGKE